MARAVLPDLAHELFLMLVDGGVGIGAIPRQHLHRVAADRADLFHAPVGNRPRLAAARSFLGTMLFQRHDETAARRQHVDCGRHREIRIEQHRAAMRREVFHQQAFCGGDIGIFDLIARDALGLRDGVEQRWPLVQRHHAKVAIRIRQARDAAVLSDRSHWCVLMKARQSLMDGMPVRPPERVHFSAAAADAKAMASCTARPAPIART